MQNKRRKLIALLLSMQCLLLAGCGNEKESETKEESDNITASTNIESNEVYEEKEMVSEVTTLQQEINESWLTDDNFSLEDTEEEIVEYGGNAFRVVKTTVVATKDSVCESELFTTFVREFKPGEKFEIVKIYLGDKLVCVRQTKVGSKIEEVVRSTFSKTKDTIEDIKESDTYNLAKKELGEVWDKAKESYENDVNDLKKLLKK